MRRAVTGITQVYPSDLAAINMDRTGHHALPTAFPDSANIQAVTATGQHELREHRRSSRAINGLGRGKIGSKSATFCSEMSIPWSINLFGCDLAPVPGLVAFLN